MLDFWLSFAICWHIMLVTKISCTAFDSVFIVLGRVPRMAHRYFQVVGLRTGAFFFFSLFLVGRAKYGHDVPVFNIPAFLGRLEIAGCYYGRRRGIVQRMGERGGESL